MAGYAAEDSQMESDWDGRQLLEYGNAVEDEVDCTVKVADGFSESQRQGTDVGPSNITLRLKECRFSDSSPPEIL